MNTIRQRAAFVAAIFGIAYAANRWPRATTVGLIGSWVVLGSEPKREQPKS